MRSCYRSIRWLPLMILFGVACGDDPTPGVIEPPGPGEVISTPQAPQGAAGVLLNESRVYRTGGAVSSLGHPVQYRFDFDADGNHAYSPWSDADSVVQEWLSPGLFKVRAHARCAVHTDVESVGSAKETVNVNMVPTTEILRVVNTYWTGNATVVDTIDFEDTEPDTVPYGSWITVHYRGSEPLFDPTQCADPVNECLYYQIRYEAISTREPTFDEKSPWLPLDPDDSNPFGVDDSTTLNIGTVDYTIFARTTNLPRISDPAPPSIRIFGSHSPVLDALWLVDQEGRVLAGGDTLTWNWWNPVAEGFVEIGGEVRLTKTFRFTVWARGHDHPKELPGSGVLSWRYEFRRALDGTLLPLGRSNVWVPSLTETLLVDEVKVVLDYPVGDVQGDAVFIDRPPAWQNQNLDFSIVGQDRRVPAEMFEQQVVYFGQPQIQNRYDASRVARTTEKGQTRFHLRLVR